MDEQLEKLLDEYGIEDIDLMEDDLDMLILPTEEERPTWMD